MEGNRKKKLRKVGKKNRTRETSIESLKNSTTKERKKRKTPQCYVLERKASSVRKGRNACRGSTCDRKRKTF